MEKSTGPWTEFQSSSPSAESGPWDDFKAAPEKPRTRGLFEAVNDNVIEFANAAAGGVSALANMVKPGNAVSSFIDENIIKAGEQKQSDVVQGAKRQLSEGLQSAQGIGDEVGAVGSYVLNNPLLAASQAAGSFALPGGAVKGAGAAAKALGAGAKGIETAGRVGGIAAGAAMAGGDAAGTAYDLASKAGATEDQALAAGRQASVIPALVGGVTGAFGAERLLAGAKGFGGNALSRGLKSGLSEAGQEALEEGVTQFEGQRAAMPYDATIDPTKGVAGAAAMGGIMGFGPGAVLGAMGGGPELPSKQMGIDPNAGPLSRAAASAVDSQPVQSAEPTQSIGGSITGTAPESLMGRASDPLAAQIMERRQQEAADATPAQQSEPVPLEQRGLDELRQAFRSAQDPAIRKTLAAEIRKRREAMPDPLEPSKPTATWDTMKPGEMVTLYRGETSANEANGQWWTTDRAKAEKYGAVTEVTLPAELVASNAARGHNRADEFVFPNKRPSDLVSQATEGVANAAQTETSPAVAQEAAASPASESGVLGDAGDPAAGSTGTSATAGQPNKLKEARNARRAADELRGTTGASTVTGGDITPPSVESPLADVRSGGRNNDAGTAQPDANGDAGGAVGSTAQGSAALRPDNWRGNAIKAGKVARSLGLDPKGKRLKEIVAEIDAKDAESLTPEQRADAIRKAMTVEQIRAELSKVSERAKSIEKEVKPFDMPGRTAIDFMTAEEKAYAHALKLALPSAAEEAAAAKERVAKRIAERKAKANVQNTPQGTAGEAKAPSVKESKAEGGNAVADTGVPAAGDTPAMENDGVKSREVMPAGLTLEVGGKFYPVDSLAQASEMVSQAKNRFTEAKANGKAVGFVEDAPIRDGAGRIVGYVGRGGSVFDTPNAGPLAKKLYDAGAELAQPVGSAEEASRTALPKPAAPGAGDVQADGVKEEAKKDAAPAAKPKATELTPKQFHEAKLAFIAADSGADMAQVREMYDTEGGRAEHQREWLRDVEAAAKAGETLSRQTLDKLYELAPNARLPETATPNGYQRPEARKAETEEKQARIDNRKAAKASVKAPAAQAEPEQNKFAEYDALARQYGYEVRPDGSIGSDGKFPGVTMSVKKGRLRIEGKNGNLLGSYAPAPESLGKFLKSFWYAEKKTANEKKPAELPMPSRDDPFFDQKNAIRQLQNTINSGVDPQGGPLREERREGYEKRIKALQDEIAQAEKPAEQVNPEPSKAAQPKAEKPAEEAPAPEKPYDAARAQELRNSIAEGELILSSGKSNGKRLTAQQLEAVRRSVDSSRAKLDSLGEDDAFMGDKDKSKRQGTPVDRAIMDMAGEGREANEILSFIAKSSKSPYRRQLAQKLLATGANPAVSLGGEMGGGAGFRFLAKYSRKNHEVTLSEAAADRAEQIFLHETTHAATLLALDKGGLFATQMNRLYESVKAQGGAEGQYGLKNVGEFVAEAFTNPDFQKALKGMKADNGSLWDRLVNIVRRILGMESKEQDALSAALDLGAKVMRENMPLRAARSFRAEDGPAFAGADQTETPAFRKWFGGSKVVDAQGKPLVSRSSLVAARKAAMLEGRMNGGASNAKSIADLLVSQAFSLEGLGGLEIPAQREVLNGVLSLGDDLKVLGSVVDLVPVDVVNILAGKNLAPEVLFRDEAVLKQLLSADRDGSVSTAIDVADALVLAVTRMAAKGPSIAPNPFFRSEKGRAAADTGETGVLHGGIVNQTIGNNGNFDPDDADIAHFGIADAVEQIKAFDVKEAPKNTWAHYRGMALQALGRRQLVDLYGDEFGTHLHEYDTLVQQMDAEKNETGAEADDIAQRWGKLKDEKALAELMHDATLAKMDPDKPMPAGYSKAEYDRLKTRFNTLSPEAKTLYREARDMYVAHYKAVQQAIKDRIERSEMSPSEKKRMMAQLDDKLFKELQGVYFPLARFGQYVIVVKDANGEVKNVTRAETVKEAEQARKELQKAFPAHMGNTVGKVLKQAEFNAGRDAVGKGFMADLMNALDEKGVDDELRDTVAQLYLSSLPDLSWAKHGIHRKGTPGFSQDARRAFAQNAFHGARYLAKLRYSDRLQDELAGMQEYVKAFEGVEEYDSIQGQQVVDEMVKRHEILMNPKSSPVSTALTSFGFLFHMGLSPASAMVNLTQTALVAYPQMGAKWGFGKAGSALTKASEEVVRAKNDLSKSLKGDELAAFDRAVKDGTIDVTMAHDLAGIAQGEDQGVMWKVRPVMRWASAMFHHAEKFNRQATFIAAYRLSKETNQGRSEDWHYEEAKKATYDGHFDYSAANRARIMQGNWQRVILLFKQYSQSMIYTLARNAYQSVKAIDPKERTQARKTLGGILAAHAAAAGVLGLPIVGPLLTVASWIGGDDDEPWDAEVAMQNAMAEMIGPKAAEVVARGFSRLTPFDLSGRVALNKLILPDVQEGLEGKEWAESAMAAALGPVAGIGVNMARGAQKITEGDYLRGLEDMMPTALRGPLKALRYANEGAVDKTGIVITDEVSAAGVLGQASGFSPSQVRRDTERRSAIYAYDRALLERRSVLMRMMAEARIQGDTETQAEVQKDIQRFNEKNPTRRITPMNIAQSVRNRRKRIDEAEQGVYLPSKRRDALDAVSF